MNFLAPEMLLGLLLVPIAIGFYMWAQRRRSKYAVRFTNLALLSNLVPKRPSWRRHLPPVLYLGAIAALLIGLARPTLIVPVPREDATVILTMDVSGSMRATDVSPTRLDAARASALSFIEQLPENVRVGIVAFASEPVTLVSPTTDRTQLKAAIGSLTARDGTAMGDALMQVLDIAEKIQKDAETPDASATPTPTAATTPAPGASGAPGAPVDEPSDQPLVAAILLSDGANSVGKTEPAEAAARAKALGVPIYTIALGTPDGKVTVRDELGQLQTLEVPPDTKTLKEIASTTGGTAFDAPTAEQLKSVYDNLQSRIGYTEERQEVTFALVAAGLLLVVVGAGLSAVWFGRLP
jgi:Ca-activated chloride channel homolog